MILRQPHYIYTSNTKMQHGLVYQIKPSSVTRAVSGVVIIQWRVFQRVNKIAKRVHMLEKKRCEKKSDQGTHLTTMEKRCLPSGTHLDSRINT